jgi:hypothetical protein
MAAIDLVTANEFTFTPSAFIAAYIENTKDEASVIETVVNGGTLTTVPNGENTPSSAHSSLITQLLSANKGVAEVAKVAGFAPVTDTGRVGSGAGTTTSGTNLIFQLDPVAAAGVSGVSPGSEGPLTVQGAVIDFLGQRVTDTRTTTKTIASSYNLSVVLVLSYGTFKSPAENRASALDTIDLIYARVAAYLNSL